MDRGRPVARISPVQEDFPEHLLRMAREGRIRLGSGIPAAFWKGDFVEDPEGGLLRALLEDREVSR